MKGFVIVGCMVLSGCAGLSADQSTPGAELVQAPFNVAQACNMPQPSSSARLARTDELEARVRALVAERQRRIGYQSEQVAALMRCH